VQAQLQPLLAGADGLIDFTVPPATVAFAEQLAGKGLVHVIGTTGLTAADEAAIAEAGKRATVVKSGNMSLGVNLLAALVKRVAKTLDEQPTSELIFVNLHAMELADDSLIAPDAPLSRHAGRVVLEVTERAPLEQIRDVTARVGQLRALGYRIAVDDLGAGYAGLTSFAHLEPEVVKVDMSLIRGIDLSPMKQKLLGSIVGLCRDLGIEIIAEGVETEAERDALVKVGGDLCQGYLFARPDRPWAVTNFGS